jgi:hypothetical protein
MNTIITIRVADAGFGFAAGTLLTVCRSPKPETLQHLADRALPGRFSALRTPASDLLLDADDLVDRYVYVAPRPAVAGEIQGETLVDRLCY